jgi:hypothetical protein
MNGMRSPDGEEPPGLLLGSQQMMRVNDLAIDLFFPRLGAPQPGWQRRIIGVVDALSRVGDRALRVAA